jgi:hypothetical protein
MLICSLCGLHVETIPKDAVLIGKLQRFSNGEFHLLRKKLEPRTGPRPRKKKPDREGPVLPPIIIPCQVDAPAPPKKPKEKAEKRNIEVFLNETSMERAFRLAAMTSTTGETK